MISLLGETRDRAEWDVLLPDLARIADIRQFREENGPNSGQRVIRVETGGGLSVELLPDRCCDIGQVWMRGLPFGWTGPIGLSEPARLRGNLPLSGLMTTCGFDHIRQPVTEAEQSFPMHGSMMHQGATIRAAGLAWEQGQGLLRIEAEVTSFTLGYGGVRLERRIDLPLGGAEIRVHDWVQVLAQPVSLMAMYHINFGYPLAGPASRLTLNGIDANGGALDVEGVTTRPAGQGAAEVVLSAGDGANVPRFRLGFDAEALPVFQVLRNATPGVNLVCLEPATHDRLPRADLRASGALVPTPVGKGRAFHLSLQFHA